MKRFLSLLAPAALLLPLIAVYGSHAVEAQDAQASRPGQSGGPVLGFDPATASPFDALEQIRRPAPQSQVRIQQRVVIRVGPAVPVERSSMIAELPRRQMAQRFEEEEHGNCIETDALMGVRPMRDNRLLFFTDDSEVLAAQLENGCSARAFYAGFYMERTSDGRLCVARDRLQSRAGGSCQITEFSRLVPVAN